MELGPINPITEILVAQELMGRERKYHRITHLSPKGNRSKAYFIKNLNHAPAKFFILPAAHSRLANYIHVCNIKIPKYKTHSINFGLYSVQVLERSELGGSHGCPGRLWDRFL